MSQKGRDPNAPVTFSDLLERAAQARRVAKSMSRQSDRQTLLEIAAELEEAAAKLEQTTE